MRSGSITLLPDFLSCLFIPITTAMCGDDHVTTKTKMTTSMDNYGGNEASSIFFVDRGTLCGILF